MALAERPLYSVGTTNNQVIGSTIFASRADLINIAKSTAIDAINNAINNANNAALTSITSSTTAIEENDEMNISTSTTTTTTTKKKTKKKVSKARLKARKAGKKKQRWDKYKIENEIEVAAFKEALIIQEKKEMEQRYQHEQKLKPPNPYKSYFGKDVRKLYPYQKYLDQKQNVTSLLDIDHQITEMQKDIVERDTYLANHRLFEVVIPYSKKRIEAGLDSQKGKSSFITNNKSSKLLFGGSMDTITHESEWHQAWNHYNEGLSIWDAVRLGDVPRVSELLNKSKKYREKVARYKRRGWKPLPAFERDHLNARGVDGQTPLHLVVMMRDNTLHDEIFQLLMQHDANISAQTIEGYTPLHYCMASNLEQMDMMVQLLDKSDEQKKRFDVNNNKNTTTDEKYSGYSLEQLAQMTENIQKDREVEELENLGLTTQNLAKKWICQKCNHSNPAGLHGVKVCGACRKVPSKWFLELELEKRPIDMATVYGETLTSMAIKSGRRDRLALVLKYNPDMNRPDEEGDTMLMSAVKKNRLDLIQLLLKYGANGSTSNYYSETALTYAQDRCLENDDDILMMLTDANGDLPYIKLNMRWQKPDDEWHVSEKVLHEQRILHRKKTNKGSKVKWNNQAKSKRRHGLEHELPTKFQIDYGTWFGGTKARKK